MHTTGTYCIKYNDIFYDEISNYEIHIIQTGQFYSRDHHERITDGRYT
jgi:hypothetical protein